MMSKPSERASPFDLEARVSNGIPQGGGGWEEVIVEAPF